jgi:hypothetical protein
MGKVSHLATVCRMPRPRESIIAVGDYWDHPLSRMMTAVM